MVLALLSTVAGCGGGTWSPGDPLPGWMDDLASHVPSNVIDASAIQGSGYDSSDRRFRILESTFSLEVTGILPRTLPLRMESGIRVKVTYEPEGGKSIDFTLDGDNPAFRLPLRPGHGTLHLVGTPLLASSTCVVHFED
jgi:hypothetical protein